MRLSLKDMEARFKRHVGHTNIFLCKFFEVIPGTLEYHVHIKAVESIQIL